MVLSEADKMCTIAIMHVGCYLLVYSKLRLGYKHLVGALIVDAAYA